MDHFPSIKSIPYEGPKSRNPLAFKHYNPEEIVEGKSLREHLRFSVCYWHTFRGTGADPFGAPTLQRPWDDGSESVDNAKRRVDAAFEFMSKLGARSTAFTTGTSPLTGRPSPRPTAISTRSSRSSRRPRSGPESSCCGGRRTCSRTRATCTARRPAPTPTSSPTRRPR